MKKRRKAKAARKITNKKTAQKRVRKPAGNFNKKDFALFKKLLLARKDAALDDIQHISDDTLKKSQKDASGDISGYTYHMADVATDTYDREFSLSLASNERELLYELQDALKKIEDGNFGICEDCQISITKNRLRAVPYARLCVKCQEKREKR